MGLGPLKPPEVLRESGRSCAACALTLIAQAVLGLGFDEHHPAHFKQEEWFGFEAAFGFTAFVGVVFLGRLLRLLVKRPEDYYE